MHRFYKKEYPQVDDLVMVRIEKMEDSLAYGVLLEYADLEAMVNYKEVSSRKIRSIKDHLKVGQTYVMQILKIDHINNTSESRRTYIDLTKKHVREDEINEHKEYFHKSELVDRILKQLVFTSEYSLEQLYREVVWPLYEEFDHCYDAFQQYRDGGLQDLFPDCAISHPKLFEHLTASIQKYILIPKYSVYTELEITSYCNGVNCIKEALNAAQQLGSVDEPIEAKCIAPPLYSLCIKTLHPEAGIEKLNQAIAKTKTILDANKANMEIKRDPVVKQD